ncbi:MAG: hypothetical protein Q8O19_07595, partial [Rectinemataceae bacterium]|nr:hypothetical protein [Rectinemataceae bacterium]
MKMKVLILYNIATMIQKGVADDLLCEQEIKIILPLIIDLLRNKGHEVESLETNLTLWENLKERKGKFDIVLNLAEAFGGGNKNEALVPMMLEALGIPFTGASAQNMSFTMDKEKTNLVMNAYGIAVPGHQVFRNETAVLDPSLKFPLIVKPIREEASIGIRLDSVVRNEGDLRKKVGEVLSLYRQPALVESF